MDLITRFEFVTLPNCIYILYLLIVYALSAVCVECLLSKLKLVKNRLRNQSSQTTLESLLMIAMERWV